MPPEHFLTIPCEPGKPDLVKPLHLSRTSPEGVASSRWQCPHCGRQFFRRKPCGQHMGLFSNIPATCPILQAQDDKRRQKEFPYDDR